MRFDLTQAAYRVLERSSRCRLPNGSSEIVAAKLLIALFEEEECRAVDWLTEAGLSLAGFRTAFGLSEEFSGEGAKKISRLESPISAPSFPMGSYGISPGQAQPVELGPQKMELAPIAGDSPPLPAGTSEAAPLDEWTESKRSRGTYSIFPHFSTESGETNRGEPVLFFLEDQPVRIGRLSKELESTFWMLLHHFGKQVGSKAAASGNELPSLPHVRQGLSNVSLATEHLLLAVALDEGEVGRWLRNNGFDSAEFFDKIEKQAAHETHRSELEDGQAVSLENLAEVSRSLQLDIPPNTEHRTTNTEFSENRLFRLLDAVSNRASEALRVVEDYVRFVLDDRSLTSQLKEFRHELRKFLRPFSNAQRLTARNTEQDVGTELEGDGEYERRGTADVLSASFGRLQESLRSLEEFSKIETPRSAREFERLRYRSYTLHQDVLARIFEDTQSTSKNSPPEPGPVVPVLKEVPTLKDLLQFARLYVLTDAGPDEEKFREKIRTLIDAGADVIQLRDKAADDRTLLDRARILRESTRQAERRVLFVMNDRPDLAVLAEADGVHVGQEELSVRDVRMIVGEKMLIGVSTHDMEQARAAVRDGADYLGAGPTFPSSTKNFDGYPGLDFLRSVAAEISLPVFAIGGIDKENVSQVLETGIHRIAISKAADQIAELAEIIYGKMSVIPAKAGT